MRERTPDQDAPLWALDPGTRFGRDGEVVFRVWAPLAERVELLLGGASEERVSMDPEPRGYFSKTVAARAGLLYAYSLDGGPARPDPASRGQPRGVHGPSELIDPGRFRWSDSGWRGVAQRDLVIYEAHVGTYTREGTFAGMIPHLKYLVQELGVTALELMPVAQFPGSRNWGYDGVSLYAVQESYGGARGLDGLVDACHRAGLAVILDVVYNHLGPEGNYLAEFGPYFSGRYKTPWGPAVNYDGSGSDEVRRFVVNNALYWIVEHHFDGLRLDAIHGIFDFSAKHILAQIAESVRGVEGALGRRLHVIAESDLNDPKIIRARTLGGYALDGQWSDDFHHAVHAYLTGERSGYYQDFGRMADIASAIRDGFVYGGRYSAFRGMTHGASSKGLPPERFVVFIQNHDQVGNRPDGSRLSRLVEPEAAKAAAALLILSPFVPLIFMGEEYAETAPFYYFISHGDPGLVEAVREGRKAELKGQGWDGPTHDPFAESTFKASKLDHGLRAAKGHREVLLHYRELVRLRKAHPALGGGKGVRSEVRVLGDGACLEVRRRAPGAEELAAFFVLGDAPVTALLPARPGWQRIYFSGDDVPDHVPRRASGRVELPPTSATLFYRRESRKGGR